MLKKIRILLAGLFWTAITLMFLDFTGTLHAWFSWMAEIQFLPALLAVNVVVIVLLLLLTILFGRIYCSVICPLGVFQDLVSWLSGKRKKHKNRFSYSPAKNWLRYSVLAAFILLFILGLNAIAMIIAPYSAYGRIASELFSPIYSWGNNILAYLAERIDSYAFYHHDVWIKSLSVFLVSIISLIVIVVLAWRNGRIYCNTICPVGSVLGFISKFSLFKITINKDVCNHCELCARNCKASCIDPKQQTIDYSRCVDCFDCLEKCKKRAIKFRYCPSFSKAAKVESSTPSENIDRPRREMLSIAGAFLATSVVSAQEEKVDGGLAILEKKQRPSRKTPIVPAGSLSVRHFEQHCSSCQLCVSACPNDVLHPSNNILRLMQPELSYEKGFCRPECTKCSDVCPSDAIRPIRKEEKSSIQIGHAVWLKKNCLPFSDDVECGNCARHCPTGAITMVTSPDKHSYPSINTERCIGCGACEYVCPARPFTAIHVEGNEVHHTI